MKFCMKKLCFIGVGLIAITASSVFAGVLEDFEGSYTGPGSLVPDPADPSNQVLKLVSNRGVMGVDAEIFSIDTNGFTGKITMDIFDFGATTWDGPANPPFPADPVNGGIDNGPRWGIQGDSDSDGELDNWVAAGIIQRTASNGDPIINANQGYAYVHDNIAGDGQRAFSFNGDWFTPNFFGNPRRVKTDPLGGQPSEGDGLQLIDKDNGGTPDAPLTPGTGAWTTWEFDIAASGDVTITARAGTDTPYLDDTQTQYNPFGPPGIGNMKVENLQQIWVTGGQNDVNDPNTGINKLGSILGTHGVLVDNITFDGASDFSPADFDTDSDVDEDDLTIWQAAYGSGAGGDTDGDSDSDGADFLTWQKEFTGPGTLSGVASVPEPSTALLLLSGFLAMTGLATRKRG